MADEPQYLSDYIDVAARIAELREKHPEASLQPADLADPFQIITVGDQTFIVYVAACYRSPNDDRPGIGIAWEPYPGTTSFTRQSELQNVETSAWGRAIVAALAADTKKGIASAEEVRNRVGGAGDKPTGAGTTRLASTKATQKQQGAVRALLAKKHRGEWPVNVVEHFEGDVPTVEQMTKKQASKVIDLMQAAPEEPKAERRSTMREHVKQAPTAVRNQDGEPVDIREPGDARPVDAQIAGEESF